MSDSDLKKWIKQFAKTELKAYGFSLAKPRILERHLECLRQGLEFQPGSGHLSGKFTVNVYWSYKLSPIQDDVSMHATKRIGYFIKGSDTWYSRNDAQDFLAVKEIILDRVMPYLDRFVSIPGILRALDEGQLSVDSAFPADAGWREFYLGYCCLQTGDAERAKVHLDRVVREHSAYPYPWVWERRDAAMATLETI